MVETVAQSDPSIFRLSHSAHNEELMTAFERQLESALGRNVTVVLPLVMPDYTASHTLGPKTRRIVAAGRRDRQADGYNMVLISETDAERHTWESIAPQPLRRLVGELDQLTEFSDVREARPVTLDFVPAGRPDLRIIYNAPLVSSLVDANALRVYGLRHAGQPDRPLVAGDLNWILELGR